MANSGLFRVLHCDVYLYKVRIIIILEQADFLQQKFPSRLESENKLTYNNDQTSHWLPLTGASPGQVRGDGHGYEG